jgi:hypothetical protein
MSIEELLQPYAVVRGEAVAGKASEIRRELLKLNSSLNEMVFDLAELLAQAKAGALYQAWGFKTFEDYVTDELDLKVRRAHYLTRIVQVCSQVGIERLVYEPVGVAKLREITRLDPAGSFFNTETKDSEPLAQHIRRLIESPEMKLPEVIQEVKRLLGLTGDDELVWVNWSVKRAVRDNVIIPAQELARQKMGSAGRDSEGNAVEFSDSSTEEVIHQAYLLDPDSYAEEPDESQEQIEESAEVDSEPPATGIRI